MGKIVKNKQQCVVSNCNNVDGANISLHHFPKAKEFLEKWKSFCNIKKSGTVSKNCVICSEHFTSDCFIAPGFPVNQKSTTNRTLNESAIPTVLFKENDRMSNSLLKCRVCLVTGNDFENIFSEQNCKPNCANLITQCADIQISKDDGLPENICGDCVILLENAYQFKLLCEQSDRILRSEETIEIDEIKDDFSLRHENDENVQHGEQTIIPTMLKIERINDDDEHFNCNESFDDDNDRNSLKNETTCDVDDDWVTEKLSKAEENKINSKPDKKQLKIKSGKLKKTRIYKKCIKKYQCDECGYMAVFPSKLEIHKRSVHKGLRTAKCPNCPKSFSDQYILKCHLRIVHTDNPVNCDLCGKTFKNPRLMSQHRRRHLVEKKFKCHLCPYEALTKSSVTIHMTQHTGEQNFECNICKKTFRANSNLLNHIRQIHNDIRPYKCNVCDKRFKSSQTLRKHEVVHSGLKPFPCPLCPITYSWYNGLVIHHRNSHPEHQLETEIVMYKKFMSERNK